MKLTYATSLAGTDGGSIQGLNYAKELAKLDVDLSILSNSNNVGSINKELAEVLNKVPNWEGDVFLMNGFPTMWPRFQAERFKKLIGYTVMEGTKIPLDWVDIMNQDYMDCVFVPSTATKTLFESNGVTKRIEVIPHGFNPEVYNTEVEPIKIQATEGKYKMLFVGGWAKAEGDRKAVDVLIKAFSEEFKKAEDVILVLKINKIYNPNFDIKKVIESYNLPSHADIRLIERDLSEKELAGLYRACDCLVMPSRGEAFGMPILEAMACGLPTIVTNNDKAGYMDFCKDSAYLVDVEKEIDVPKTNEFIYDGCKWVEPSKEDLKKKMRFVFENKEVAKKTAETSLELIQDYTWKKASEKMIKIMEE